MSQENVGRDHAALSIQEVISSPREEQGIGEQPSGSNGGGAQSTQHTPSTPPQNRQLHPYPAHTEHSSPSGKTSREASVDIRVTTTHGAMILIFWTYVELGIYFLNSRQLGIVSPAREVPGSLFIVGPLIQAWWVMYGLWMSKRGWYEWSTPLTHLDVFTTLLAVFLAYFFIPFTMAVIPLMRILGVYVVLSVWVYACILRKEDLSFPVAFVSRIVVASFLLILTLPLSWLNEASYIADREQIQRSSLRGYWDVLICFSFHAVLFSVELAWQVYAVRQRMRVLTRCLLVAFVQVSLDIQRWPRWSPNGGYHHIIVYFPVRDSVGAAPWLLGWSTWIILWPLADLVATRVLRQHGLPLNSANS